ncbi:MAG TPA: HDOD domain-containing protein, partial [Deltaproteobacteria bacterium]|nr:HDOD domain-containing protein [Deltaproteobacteria bacterium]
MGTTIVASGCMEIREHGLLKAYLGSCVGVAVLDGTRRLGGLIHLLLPEPVCSVPSYQLASYASTGIPLFLEALADHGASMDNLSAFVAGGALIDPARTDLAMNIGGKTLDVTLRMLERYRIPIRRLEANGITGMCIMLDVEGRSCTIEPVTERPVAQRSKDLPMPTLSDIDRTIRSLKPIPQIALSIAEMISDDTTDLAGIASEIKKDQVLSADVLRLCNSAFLGVPRKIESIDEAVAVVGTSTLMQLVITAHMERLIGCSESGYSLMRGGLYFHSLATARLSERLARASGVAGPQTAYTCGLLHDIGKV